MKIVVRTFSLVRPPGLGWGWEAPIMGSFAKLSRPFMHDSDHDMHDMIISIMLNNHLLESYNLGRKKDV